MTRVWYHKWLKMRRRRSLTMLVMTFAKWKLRRRATAKSGVAQASNRSTCVCKRAGGMLEPHRRQDWPLLHHVV